ncbi:oligosaccharyl transferase glycoprotein complex, beta subunit [Blastocladiella emersonii ATCC 22665]|nr:oligosaccharyl transferase glycoprotein complex, beta subunit [Blastocladiella emersonii ATCC 22665]
MHRHGHHQPAKALLLAVLLLCATSAAWARSLTGTRVLALLDDAGKQGEYSKLLGSLTERGFDVKVETAAASTALFAYDEPVADHLLLIAPSKQLKSGLSPKTLVDFVKRGGNALIALDARATDSHKELAFEFGLDFDDTSDVRDFFAHAGTTPEAVAATNFAPVDALVPAALRVPDAAPVVYRGIAHTVHARDNPLIATALFANPTTHSAKRADGSGEDVLRLVSTLQTTENARIAFIGSTDALTDATFDTPVATTDRLTGTTSAGATRPSNQAFVNELVRWTFQEKSVVRAGRTAHHKVGETEQRDMYRIKDEIVFNITLQEWTGTSWAPHLADGGELQFSAKMLDPYLRVPLPLVFTTATEATYSVTTRLPDVYGVFTFAVRYTRPGLAAVTHSELVSIRPFRHNEYPRFLTVATPYYAAAAAQIAAFVVFAALWITHKPAPAAAAAEKKVATEVDPETERINKVNQLLKEEEAEKKKAAQRQAAAAAAAAEVEGSTDSIATVTATATATGVPAKPAAKKRGAGAKKKA